MAPRFNPPPNWPAPPSGWMPPPGWKPDPAWGPVPLGWSLWLDDSRTAAGVPMGEKTGIRRWYVLAGGLTCLALVTAIGVGSVYLGGANEGGGDAGAQSSSQPTEGVETIASPVEEARQADEEAEQLAVEEEARRSAEEAAAREAQEEVQRQAEEEERASAEAARLDSASYAAISDREWAIVERDPDAYIGERYVLYGHVTQFDANTGPTEFLASTSGEPKRNWYDYEVATYAAAHDVETVRDVVTNDLVTLHVEVLGSYSYATVLGGFNSVPLVQVNVISVDGSV